MNTLHTFGCSFTDNFYIENYGSTPNPAYPFLQFHNGVLPDIWPVTLSKKLGLELKNYGAAGLSNNGIFDKFCDATSGITKGDIVILEWTRLQRFRLLGDDGILYTVLPIQNESQRQGTIIDPDAIIDMQINRLQKPWKEEIYSYQNFIIEFCKIVDCELYIWAADNDLINSESDEFKKKHNYLLPEANYDMFFYLNQKYGALTITEETNGFAIDNHHYGKKGHDVVAELFYNEIKRYQNINK
jgi:hypothetical protein